MAAVSNQQYYTPIKPLPEPKVNYPVLSAVVQRVAFAVLFGFYAGAIGAFMGLVGWTASIVDGAVAGSILGVIGALAQAIFTSLPTALENYRISTLEQLEQSTNNPSALGALHNLKNFFYYPLNRFSRPFDYALLHNELTKVTDNLDRQRPDTHEVWSLFLIHLHGTSVKLPSGQLATLDMSGEYRRLRGNKERVASSWLTTYFASPDANSLREIDAIQHATLGRDERYEPSTLRAVFKSGRNNHCIVSRDQATNQIVGYGWYFRSHEGVEIGGLSRKPEYSRLGIGSELLKQMLSQFKSPESVTVRLRKSNPAVLLFEQFGFELQQELPSYYARDPKEDGLLLKLNWETYQKALG